MNTDADLSALWAAWLRDPTLHRACNLSAAIMRRTVERAAAKAPPAREEPAARVSEPDEGRGGSMRIVFDECIPRVDDPTGTDPYPPQIKPPRTVLLDTGPWPASDPIRDERDGA